MIDDLGIQLFRDHGIETRRWWNLPLHKHSIFSSSTSYDHLTNTNKLHQSDRIPFGPHLNAQSQEFVVRSLSKSLPYLSLNNYVMNIIILWALRCLII